MKESDMGYAHYWKAKPIHSIITWTAITYTVRSICAEAEKRNIKISGWDGECDPEFLSPFNGLSIESNLNDENAWATFGDQLQASGSLLGEWIILDLAIANSRNEGKGVPLIQRTESTSPPKTTGKLFKRRGFISNLYKNEADFAIRFNGSRDKSYESFCIDRCFENLGYCKTERRPYDAVVTASLLALNYISGIEIKSDGRPEDWKNGLALAKKIIPEIEIPSTI